MNRVQLDRFRTALAMLPPMPASLSATGGVLLGKDYLFDMVRPGIGLYGGNPNPGRPDPFAVAACVTARILQVRARGQRGKRWLWRDVPYQAPFGACYCGVGICGRTLCAPFPIVDRAPLAGSPPVAGRVSMDLVTLDVTDLSSVPAMGTQVEFIGDTITLEEIAQAANTISYEILTSLSHRAAPHYEDAP